MKRLGWKPFHMAPEWAWVCQSCWSYLEKLSVISKVKYFSFLVSCLYTFNPVSLSLKWVTTLVATLWRNMESKQPAKLPTWWGSRGQRGDHFFIFRLNFVLHDSDQVDESVMETEEWKKKFYQACWRHQLYLKETVLYGY